MTPKWFRRTVRVVRLSVVGCFYFFALKTCVICLGIAHGWHDNPPEGLRTLNPWIILLDGAIAVGMYILHDKLSEIQ